ncbi:MAG: hypothetical protein ACE5JR_02630 [Gemmatimonadota bacterium]
MSQVIVQLRRISARSVFLVAMTLYGIVGVLVGVVLAIVATLEVPPGSEGNLLTRLGMWSVLLFPVLYGVIGGAAAAVAAALYNAAAAVVGGIRMDISDLTRPKPSAGGSGPAARTGPADDEP